MEKKKNWSKETSYEKRKSLPISYLLKCAPESSKRLSTHFIFGIHIILLILFLCVCVIILCVRDNNLSSGYVCSGMYVTQVKGVWVLVSTVVSTGIINKE